LAPRTNIWKAAQICWCAVAVCLLASLAFVPVAGAAVGDPSIDQCFSSTVVASCAQYAPTASAVDVELSPDGGQAYVLGQSPATIRIFDRGADGRLTPRPGADGCYNAAGAGGCTAVGGLAQPGWDLALSPDGTSLYVAAEGSVAHLRRNPATGSLTPAQCYGSGAGCTALTPAAASYAVVVSLDGQDVYTKGENTLRALQRNTTTGALVPEPDAEDCFTETTTAGCTDTYGLAGNAFDMQFSPDGKFLYYPIQLPGGIGFFQRSANGGLTQISGPQGGCITTDGSSSSVGECATIGDGSGAAMTNGWAATLSPSGRYAFLSGSSGTVVFSRDQETGKLSKVFCIAPSVINGCVQRPGSAGMGVEVSPGGTEAMVDGSDIAGLGVYSFNEASGALTQLGSPLGCFGSGPPVGCSLFPGGSNYGKGDWGANGLNFYATAGNGFLNMSVDRAPVCQGRTVTVPSNTSTAIPLSCSDPNGDPLTLQVSRPVTAGALAGIDQAAGTVRYNPFGGYTGPDSFGYTATGRGVASAEASVTINVQSPSSQGPNPGPLTNKVLAKWNPGKKFTTMKSLSVAEVPAGVSVRVACKGKGCPLATKTISVKKAGDQKLTQLFNFAKKVKGHRRTIVSKLRVGTVVEVQVNAADRIGKAVRFSMRKGKAPAVTNLCTPPGSVKSQPC
jgi:ribosomal protein S8E